MLDASQSSSLNPSRMPASPTYGARPELHGKYRSPRDPKSTQRQLAAGRAQKIPPISGITVPALVFCGRDDPIIKPRGSKDIAARIPGATLVIYPGMGHNLPEELWPDFTARISALAGS